MYRNIILRLKEWKNKQNRKPLILAGARQVGKTYILKKFGEQEFDNFAYIELTLFSYPLNTTLSAYI